MELRAWRRMRRILDRHELEHRNICREWRIRLRNNFRTFSTKGKGETCEKAQADLTLQIEEKRDEWAREAQQAQDAIDPFVAPLDCPPSPSP
jgi:hypothetical protein